MRILLTNNHLARLGGSETWIYTMAMELKDQGHDVGVFTHDRGVVSNMLGDLMDYEPSGYDLALINHNTCINVDARFKIYTSHGTVPELEKPVAGADVYVAVNENTADYHKIDKIIKNPIDTDLFRPTSEIRGVPQSILSITDEFVSLPYHIITPSRTEYNMSHLINQADIVISMGRGALEAMSCARNVVTWDKRPYWESRGDGYIDNFDMLKGNTAGQYARNDIVLTDEIAKYDKSQGKKNREYILENHDVKKIVNQYLQLYGN